MQSQLYSGFHTGALPVGLRQSGKSGAAPWWRWSTEQPADGQTSAGTCCCIPGDPDHGTGRLLTDLSSVNHNIANQPHVLIWHEGLVLFFSLCTTNSQTSSSVNIPEVFCRIAYIQCATVTACFQLW